MRRDTKKKIPGQLIRNRVVARQRRGEPSVDAWAIPAKSIGRFFERCWTRYALRPEPERAVRPDMHFPDFTNRAGLNVLNHGPRIIQGVALIAHLCGDFSFL